MALDEIKLKIEELSKRYAVVSKKKSELHGQLEAKKAELVALSKEIKDAGYDPRKLKEERDTKEAQLTSMIEEFDKNLAEAEAAIREYDKK